jgi:hypothetical protein
VAILSVSDQARSANNEWADETFIRSPTRSHRKTRSFGHSCVDSADPERPVPSVEAIRPRVNKEEKIMMRAVYVVAAAALAAVPAACDDAGGTGGGGENTPPPVVESPAASGSGEGTQTNQPPPPPEGGVLANDTVQVQGSELSIDITSLKRQGQSMTLEFRITNVRSDSDWYAEDTLGRDLGAFDYDHTVSGVELVDPVNAQRYLVARSDGEDGECACSSTRGVYLSEGDSVEFYATYAAPPPDVTAINVEFPTFGAFTDVPIS